MTILKNGSLFCLLILFGLSNNGWSQETNITGRVVDAANRMPLKGADVYFVISQEGTTTDDDGVFRLIRSNAAKNDTLVVGFLGYREYRTPLSQFENRSEIRLQPISFDLPDSILVRADRIDLVKQEIPHSRSVIDFEAIELRGTGEISDLFKSIPSVRIEGNDLSGRNIQIRGSDASEVNVYVDGILINNLGVDNTADLTLIPTENIEKIEILKGANLTLLGNGAFGGVVNVTTQKNLQESLYAKTKQGSFNSRYFITELNLPVTRRFVINYFAQYNNLEPTIEYFPGERFSDKSENNKIETDKQNHHLSLNYYMKEGELSGRVFGYLLDYKKPLWNNDRRNFLFSGAYRGVLLGVRNFDLSANYLYSDDQVERDTGGDSQYLSGFQTGRLNMKLLKKFTFSGNELQLLGEYYHDEVESTVDVKSAGDLAPLYRASLYENRWSVAGVMAFSDQFNHLPYVTWKTHFGMRGDFIATGDHYVSPTIGLQVEIDRPQWTLTPHANYGKNVKIQTLLDNAYVSLLDIDVEDTTLVRLKPEESSSYEFGASFSFRPESPYYESLETSVAVFRNTVFNKLLRRPFEPLTVESQVGRNVTRGVEASLKFNSFLKHFNFLASITELDISDPLLYAYKPENAYSIQLDMLSGLGLYVSSTFFYEGNSIAWFYDTDNNFDTQTIPSYYDVDLSVGFRFRLAALKFHLQASAYNLLDNSEFRYYLLRKQFFQVSLSAKY